MTLHPPGAVAPSSGFEFDGAQNKVIAGLAGAMKFVGVLLMIYGALVTVLGVGHALFAKSYASGAFAGIGGMLYLGAGSSISEASSYFSRVVSTSGQDIENLMLALRHLGALFRMVMWLTIAATILAAISIAFTIVTSR